MPEFPKGAKSEWPPNNVVSNIFDGNCPITTTPEGGVKRDTSNPIDGENSLEATESPTEAIIDGAPEAEPGKKWCGSIRTPPSGGQSELWYGVQDSSNLYFVGLDSDNNEVTMGYYSSGVKTVNDTVSAPVSAGTVFDIELTWRTNDEQEATITER